MLDRDATEVRRNGEWLDMPMEDLFRLARTATVAQLLERDDFAKRYSAGEPISVLELLYPLLQGYDSVAIRADVELGATDQKFNVLLAREVQRAYGVEPQSILCMPILPGIDGVQKMSKSLGNYVGVDDPPEEMYGKLMRVPDDAMPIYYELLLDEPFDPSVPPRDAKRAMARALTAHYHGEEGAAAAQERFDALHVRHELPERDRGLRLRRQRGRRAPAGAAGGGVRRVALGGAAAAGPVRREARRGGARRRFARPAGRAARRRRDPAGQAAPQAPAPTLGPPLRCYTASVAPQAQWRPHP